MLKNLVSGLTEDQLKLFIALAGGIALVLGALITAIATALIARWNRNAAAKSEFRKLAIEAALENWRHQNELKIETVKIDPNAKVRLDAPDYYIAHMLRLMHIAADMKLTYDEASKQITGFAREARLAQEAATPTIPADLSMDGLMNTLMKKYENNEPPPK